MTQLEETFLKRARCALDELDSVEERLTTNKAISPEDKAQYQRQLVFDFSIIIVLTGFTRIDNAGLSDQSIEELTVIETQAKKIIAPYLDETMTA